MQETQKVMTLTNLTAKKMFTQATLYQKMKEPPGIGKRKRLL